MSHEIQLLETLWKRATEKESGNHYYRADKSTELIIPRVDYCQDSRTGDLNNSHWTFNVPYAFRDALGLSFDQRFKDKKPYMVWVQGPYIDFKEGDSLKSKSGDISLSVKMATPMSRNRKTHIIDYGLVDFQILKRDEDGKLHYHSMRTLNQYEFLQTLIYGLPDSDL
ncbi:hypothetical protein [Marinomonas atlantica]|uniref:hypothetical protein n=1 Tax=Marinomonas atlantica TaxID=1806668 RepID=UPI0008324634|nr:hypothetical protein [Marinomonas atlantica]